MDQLTQNYDLFGTIKPRKFKVYVTSLGWSLERDFEDKFYIYRKADGGQVLIPKDTSAPDYARRVADAIMIISQAEGRPVGPIVNEIFNPDADIYRFRLGGNRYEDGTAPLGEGLNLFASSRRSLYIAAMQVKRPSTYYKKLSNSEIENFISACRIGQTERSSFVATVVCPLVINGFETNLNLFSGEMASIQSFTRKVTENYFHSVNSIVKAIDNDSLDFLKSSDGEYLVSSNFCASLVEMQPDEGNSFLELSVNMSHNDFIPSVGSKVKIDRDYFPLIEQIGKSIKPASENVVKTYYGKVKTLNGAPGDDGKVQGEVVVTFIDEDQLIRAKLDLNSDNYRLADQAHISNRTVEIKGILEEHPRISKFVSCSLFKIAD